MLLNPSKTRRWYLLSTTALMLWVLGVDSVFANGRQDVPYQSMRQSSSQMLESVLQPRRYTQNQSNQLRTRSEVIEDVKRRYDARVLRISLNREREVYEVRVLLPNGKVKNITMSARR